MEYKFSHGKFDRFNTKIIQRRASKFYSYTKLNFPTANIQKFQRRTRYKEPKQVCMYRYTQNYRRNRVHALLRVELRHYPAIRLIIGLWNNKILHERWCVCSQVEDRSLINSYSRINRDVSCLHCFFFFFFLFFFLFNLG